MMNENVCAKHLFVNNWGSREHPTFCRFCLIAPSVHDAWEMYLKGEADMEENLLINIIQYCKSFRDIPEWLQKYMSQEQIIDAEFDKQEADCSICNKRVSKKASKSGHMKRHFFNNQLPENVVTYLSHVKEVSVF